MEASMKQRKFILSHIKVFTELGMTAIVDEIKSVAEYPNLTTTGARAYINRLNCIFTLKTKENTGHCVSQKAWDLAMYIGKCGNEAWGISDNNH